MSATESPDRRAASDRRVPGERRRASDDRHVAIEITSRWLHVAFASRGTRGGRDVLLTRSVPWAEDGDSLRSGSGRANLIAALKAIVAKERLSGASTSLALSGEFCVTRMAFGPVATVDRDLQQMEERSELYLSLGVGPKCFATSRHAIDARHEHALVTIASQAIIDSIVEACEVAGLHLEMVESSMVALGRAHSLFHSDDDSPVLLVQLNDQGLEFGVAHQGRLAMEYRPGGNLSAGEVASVVSEHDNRLQRFHQRWQGQGNGRLNRILLVGTEAKIQQAQAGFEGSDKYEVCALNVKASSDFWDVRDCPVGVEYGAALGTLTLSQREISLLHGPNLLERWIRESRKHIRPLLLRSALPLVATLLLALGLGITNLRAKAINSQMAQQLALLAPTHSRFSKLRKDLIASEAKLIQLKRLEAAAHGEPIDSAITRIGACLPDDVWLDRISVSDSQTVSLSGASYTEGGVYDFVHHLEQVPGVSDVALQGTSNGQSHEGPTTNFDLKLAVGHSDEMLARETHR